MSFGTNLARLGKPARSNHGYPIAGLTADRPKDLGGEYIGLSYFDQELGRPLWWDGERWVFADGNPIPVKLLEEAAPAPAPAEPLMPGEPIEPGPHPEAAPAPNSTEALSAA